MPVILYSLLEHQSLLPVCLHGHLYSCSLYTYSQKHNVVYLSAELTCSYSLIYLVFFYSLSFLSQFAYSHS